MTNPTGRLEPTPGRHKTRRLQEPRLLVIARHQPSQQAARLAEHHNAAVRAYGSDSGGYHTYNVTTMASAGVWDGTGGFPAGTVVSPLAFGLIDDRLAQRLLEADGHGASTEPKGQ